jgi:hypothetical protein
MEDNTNANRDPNSEPFEPLFGGNPGSSLSPTTRQSVDGWAKKVRKLDELVEWAGKQLQQPENLNQQEIAQLKDILKKGKEIPELKETINQKLY